MSAASSTCEDECRASEAWVQCLQGRVRHECSAYEDECSVSALMVRMSEA